MGRRFLMNYYIDQILKEKKITVFLEERGILPAKKTGDKWIYRCPIHAGDNDPSFVVYPTGTGGKEYQTYYCFGCHSGITIINLKSDLDNSKPREAIKFFLKGINVDFKDARKSIIEDYKKGKLVLENKREIETLLLIINSTCREHLIVYNDEEEMEFFEVFFKKVDDIARAKDINMLEEVYDILMRGKVKRVEQFQARQEEQEVSSIAWRL